MSGSGLVPCLAVLLLQLWGAHTLPPTTACLVPCLCQKTPLLNCSSAGLIKVPSQIPVTATSLDLSHNALQSLAPLDSSRIRLRGLQHFWVGNNALETLSLCFGKEVNSIKTLRRNKRCVTWAPDLQMLSAERNQLKQIPGGLGSVKSLQILQLSHNRISELGPADLAGCTHLKEVYLQHNLINTVHPQAFKDLPNLQVLDLSHNLLTIIPLPAYLSLRNLNTLVAISGNRWRCDCNLKTIRRWLSFDKELGNPGWNVVCVSPPHHAGKDLLYLEESDLTCPPPVNSMPGFTKEVTVDEGTELLLSCATVTQDFIQARWWTPQGQVSENQHVLLISNITEQHAGLYVCVSGFQEEHLSIFKLHVHKRVHETRLRREAQNVLGELTKEENTNMQRNVRAVSQGQFVLAVCLSVFITFIVAFILGVLLRPLLDKCCKKIRSKIRSKRNATSSSTNSQTSSARPRPYVNNGYSDTEDDLEEVRVRSRVTFGAVTEVQDNGSNIPYYVTVEDGSLNSSSENNPYENLQGSEILTIKGNPSVEMEDLKSRENRNQSSSLQVSKEVQLKKENLKPTCGYPKAESTKIMEFEPIPEDTAELEERSISSVSSQSELSQEMESSFNVNESTEQSVDPSIIIVHEDQKAQEATMPRFTTDPLSAFKEENVDDLDPDLWNDSGESFSFPDESPRSSSRVTQIAVFDYPLFEGKEVSVDKPLDKASSCSSSESDLTEKEKTDYTVNPSDSEESGNFDLSKNNLSTLEHTTLTDKTRKDTVTLDPSDVHLTFTGREGLDDGPFADQNKGLGSSNIVYINEEEPRQYHVHPVYRTGRKTSSHLDGSGTSSSSEDEDEQAKDAYYPRKLEIKTDPEINNECVVPVKNPNSTLNINFDNSSSSTDTKEKTKKMREKKSFLKLSRLGSLFNRNGSETDKKAVQTPPKTTNKDSKKIAGFLGLSANKQTEAHEDDHKPNAKTQSLRSVSSSDDDLSPTSKGDSFFGQIGTSLNGVPRVKRYIQFTQAELQPSSVIPSSVKTERVTPVFGTKTQSVRSVSSSDDDLSPISKGDNFFGQIGTSLSGVPKVKRYIQFTQAELQPSSVIPSSVKTDKVTPVFGTKTQSVRSYSSSDDDLSPTSKGDHFFGTAGISFDGIPRVKRYIQFTQFEPQISAQSPSSSLKMESFVPVLGTKTQSVRSYSSSDDDLSPTSTGDSFFGQIGTSLNGVPRVKRYIQFTQAVPQPSSVIPSSVKIERVTPVFGTKTQSVRSVSSSDDELGPTSKGGNFFGQIGTSLNGVPKVKRYIQFTQAVPQPSSVIPSSVKIERVTPVFGTKTQSVRSYSSSDDELSPTSKGDNFFGTAGISFDGVPRVKRYIQFTQFEPQISAQSPSTSLKMESFIPVLGTKTQSVRSYSSSDDELSPTSTGDSFFGQIGTSLNGVPRVKRYIQFTQAVPQPSSVIPSSVKIERVTPVFGTKTQSVRSVSSSDDELSPTSKGGNFFGQIGTSLNGVPKVKRYIQFTQALPQPSVVLPLSVKTERVTPVFGTKTQSVRSVSSSDDDLSPTSKGGNFFGQIGTSLNGVPRVKRYIKFTQAVSQPSSVLPSSVKTEKVTPVFGTKTQSVRSYSSSDDDLSPTSKGDHFFGTAGTSFDGVPRVKRYIQFTQSEPRSSAQTLSSSIKAESFIPVLGTKTQSVRSYSSSDDERSPTTKGGNFFGQIGTSLNGVPKVKRYIQFTQAVPQPLSVLPSSVKIERVTPVFGTKTQSARSYSSSDDELSPTSKGDNFFGKTGASFNEVPKLKRYIQFTQSEPRSSTQTLSSSIKTGSFIPVLGTKTQSVRSYSSSDDELSPTSKGGNFFGQIATSLNGVPKVKRYIQFTQAVPQPLSVIPSSVKIERVTPVFGTKTQSVRSVSSSDDELSPTSKGDPFFGKTGASFNEVPKLKRYIQFTQSEPRSSTQTLSSSIKTGSFIPVLGTKTQSVRSYSSSDDELSPTSKGGNFFGQIGTSLNGVPKVKRYIQFTQAVPQPSSVLPSSVKIERVTPVLGTKTQSVRSVSSSDDEFSPTTKGGNFFGQIGTSLNGVPKVKRYIKFTQAVSQPSSVIPSSVKIERATPVFGTTTQSARSVSSSDDEISPTSKGDNFFGKTGTSFDGMPKLKRYIQFTQSEPRSSTQTLSSSIKTGSFIPVLGTKAQPVRSESSSDDELSPTTKGGNFFGQIGTSLNGVPKVKRYIQFTQAVPQPLSVVPSSVKIERVTPVFGTKTQSVRSESSSDDEISPTTKGNSFFGTAGASFNEVPKLKRYIQFTQSEPQSSAQRLSTSIRSESVTPTLVTKIQSARSDPSSEVKLNITSKGDGFSRRTDGVPTLTKYIHFTEPQPSSLLPSSIKTEKVQKVQSGRFDLLSGNELSTPSNEGNFFGQMSMSLERVPKLKRYIQFTQLEPQSLAQRPSTSLESERVTPTLVKKIHSERFVSPSEVFSTTSKEDSFFGQIDRVPQLRRSEPLSQTLSASNELIIHPDTVKNIHLSSEEADEHNLFGQTDASLDGRPRLKRYMQFTHSSSQLHSIPTSTPSLQYLDRHLATPELLTKTELSRASSSSDESINKDGGFGNTDTSLYGVPKVKGYMQFTQYRSHTSSHTPENETKPSSNKDSVFETVHASPELIPQFSQSDPKFKNQFSQSLTQKRVTAELVTKGESMSSSYSPQRTLFLSTPSPYAQPQRLHTSPQLRLSTPDSVEPRLSVSSLSTESSDFSLHNLPMPRRSLHSDTGLDKSPRLRRSLATDISLQDENKPNEETPPASSEKDDAREYLRDSSLARQRQERRRLLFQQKRRAMDGFSLTSSSESQEMDKQGSLPSHYGDTIPPHSEHSLHSVSTGPAVSASHINDDVSGLKSLSTKRISSLKNKSAMYDGSYTYRSDV